ncbi:SMI1/KNR4 family protein [Streptomyces hesseae]|uniref:SMI1/KNR4 family protein n=1 Tax=Streptomyces hesseae TaxID=3075519 RepID=A0ABU2SVV6_9ACTN|nr:SMI1/KNR4 family protein [Streptomyces sp. DSM 40473]MDT0452761.1 SMI1/KNR4 family protein [Streptomyces sp. DSM 40473]
MRRFEATYGYEPGENRLVEATGKPKHDMLRALATAGAPADLVEFYGQVECVSLPDVGNGIFVDPIEEVIEGAAGSQPTQVTGSINGSILVFGSDGGGGLFVLMPSDSKVYRISGGSLIASTYDVNDSGLEVVADTFDGFLDYIFDQLSQLV